MENVILENIPKPQEFTVTMKLFDINGEWDKKPHTHEETVYDIKDKSTISKYKKKGYQSTTQDIDGTKTDCLVRKVTKDMHAFPRDEKNNALIPMGGVRGYVAGTLKAVARNIGVKNGQPLYGILSWITNGGLGVEPMSVAVDPTHVAKDPAEFWITEAKSSAFYEHIPETEIKLKIRVQPRDGFNAALIKELLKRGETVGISPKRRGHWEIIKFD